MAMGDVKVSRADDDKQPNVKYRDLVESLASPNEWPTISKQTLQDKLYLEDFPAGYDVAVQKKIEKSRQVLFDDFEESLPYLIDALEDKRYSMTIFNRELGYYSQSVGQICKQIIASNLEVYRSSISFKGPAHWYRYNFKVSKEWWKERQGRKLYELQIDAIDWAIEQLEKDKKPVPKGDSVSDPKSDLVALTVARPDSAAAGKQIADLRALRDEIAKSKKPAKPAGMPRMVTPKAD